MTLSLFDVNQHQQLRNSVLSAQLKPHSDPNTKRGLTLDVNQLAFSPDGNLLAVARSDNWVHIFDSRKLKEPCLEFYQGPSLAMAHNRCDGYYGIACSNDMWIDEGAGLITGGGDGTVRLWNVKKAADKGEILTRSEFDVAFVCVGDRFKREKPLVVGDMRGEVIWSE